MPMLGHITSSYQSPTLGHSFGLAVIKDGHSLIGTKAFASTPDKKTIPVEIVKPIFYDEENIVGIDFPSIVRGSPPQ